MKPRGRNSSGFTLAEVMISSAIFSTISLGLLMGFTSLERSFAATTDFATNHADEMRISDYLALDLRRSTNVSPSPTPFPSPVPIISIRPSITNPLTITIPPYYDASGNPQEPTIPTPGPSSSPSSAISYGPPESSPIIKYYLLDNTIYRQQDSQTPVAIAKNVNEFSYTIVESNKVVSTKITFNPTFVSTGASAAATEATAFYNRTLLRNIDVY